jgi:uncharacterized protein
VSGLLTAQPDAPMARILDGMLTGRFAFLLSLDLLAEYRAVLLRPRICKRHGLTERAIDAMLTEITANGPFTDLEGGLLFKGDGDEHLRALLTARADAVLVTCDAALRARLSFGRAITPKAFVDLFAS